MDQRTVTLKSLLLLAVSVHLSSAVTHTLQYSCTGATRGLNLHYTAEGRLDGEPFIYYDGGTEKVIPKTEWMKKVDAVDPKQRDAQKKKLNCDPQSIKDCLDITMLSFGQTDGVHTVKWIYGCELDDDGTERRYWRYRYDGEDFLSLDLGLDTETWTAETPQAETTKLQWEKTPAAGFQKAFLKNECIEWLQKYLGYRRSTPKVEYRGSHSLQYFYTGVTGGINFPEYTEVGMVDGEQIDYYDSEIRKVTPKTDWIQKIDAEDPDYWNTETQNAQGDQENFKVSVETLMQRFNQTTGVHTVQNMYGCELHEDGTKRGYDQYGYDGEDFIILDLDTLTWTAPVFQAVPTKEKWDRSAWAVQDKAYLLNECIEWLEKYVGYGRSTLEKKVSPKVDLFQKDSPSSPVVCHATDFFPKSVMISWQKNGEDLHEDVEIRETLPNQDGTFQKRSLLTVSPEELDRNQYTCVIQHSSLKEDLVLQVSNRRILSDGGLNGVIIGAVVAVLLLVLIGVVGFFLWKKSNKESGFKPVSGNSNAPSEGDSASSNS